MEDERLVGVVSERDLFSLQRLGLGEITTEIRLARHVDAAGGLAERDPQARAAAGRRRAWPPSSSRTFVSVLNDRLCQRIARARAQAPPLGAHQLVLARLRQRGPLRADLQHRPGQRPRLRRRTTSAVARRRARAPAALRARGERGARRLRLSAVQGQRHGVEPRAVPVARGVAGEDAAAGSTPRPQGAARRLDLSSTSARCTATPTLAAALRDWIHRRSPGAAPPSCA